VPSIGPTRGALRAAVFLLALVTAAGCGGAPAQATRADPPLRHPRRFELPHPEPPPTPPRTPAELGVASWYGPGFHGRRTARGDRYDMHELTAAHPRLPFGTVCLVTNLRNGRTVLVEITDRGPFVRGRIIDLSHQAAKTLGFLRHGTAPVVVEVVREAPPAATPPAA
jgi:rare lipoprotein A